MTEIVYGVFATRSDGATPSMVKLTADRIYYTEEEANLRAGNCKLLFGCGFEVHKIECVVK